MAARLNMASLCVCMAVFACVLAPSLNSRNAIIEASLLWDYKEIPFVIRQGDYSASEVSRIQSAMEEFHQHTCVRFVQRNGQEDYLYIQRLDGCYAWIGQKHEGAQDVILGDGYCLEKGAIIHELMHAVGFWHEHQRPDRDDWVNILWDNIIDDKKGDFEKHAESGVSTLGLPYDYSSIMHYGSRSHSKNGQPTIEALFPTNGLMGQSDGLSSGDIEKINTLYSCGAAAGLTVDEHVVGVDLTLAGTGPVTTAGMVVLTGASLGYCAQ
uniref:Metalloendopeptidase n=1 Tax=Branchiostoma floridae TaxID=7739 RepID=C3Y5G5_BRAFL|eukprot:XP_002608202.1 hypothetical protein BRAFLDRAFT_90358 [Branchiostoma floridae]